MNENLNKEETKAYRGIFKATSLFGGLQIYQILIRIIQSKFIAVLLGPEGMGINGLFQTGLDLIRQFTSFGLSQSAVRDVAEASGNDNKESVEKTVAAIRKLSWLTGLLGVVVVVILSPVLSSTSLGNFRYTAHFCALSCVLLFTQLNSGDLVLLQGLRKYKYLAQASSIGITIGLFTTVPLYYLLGINGIVPALIINSIVTYLLGKYYASKIGISKLKLSIRESLNVGKSMMKFGFLLSLSGILVSGCSYILRSYISYVGGLAQVGLFNAGFAIAHTYVGMVFTAMSTDYYPRLAAVCRDNMKLSELVNRQSEVSLLIISPIIILAIIYTPLALNLLYSNEFILANDYVRWALVGMIFRTVTFCLGQVILAKGDTKVFSKTTFLFNIFFLLDDLIMFTLLGIEGLGISFCLNYLFNLVIVGIIASKRYNIRLNGSILKLFTLTFALIVTTILVSLYIDTDWMRLLTGSALFIISLGVSLYLLNVRMNLLEIIKNKLK
jgi:O-antigen/teichoic acid export membrane protein